jgi:hypothetical protein
VFSNRPSPPKNVAVCSATGKTPKNFTTRVQIFVAIATKKDREPSNARRFMSMAADVHGTGQRRVVGEWMPAQSFKMREKSPEQIRARGRTKVVASTWAQG